MSSDLATRESQAWELRSAGRSWAQIAQTVGYSSPSKASAAVRAWQKKAAYLIDITEKEYMLSEEVARLDTLQSAVWADALQGDPVAVQTALKIIQARINLLNLDNDEARVINQAVVVGGDSTAYLAQLRTVS